MYRIIGLMRIPIAAAGAGVGVSAYLNYKLEESVPDFIKNMYNKIKDIDLSLPASDSIERKTVPVLRRRLEQPKSMQVQPLESTNDSQPKDRNQLMGLSRKLIDIKQLLTQIDSETEIRLPSIVVLGSQSSGKSSVLEAIVGHEFLPKGKNMVTRRPIELDLINSEEEYCEFPQLKLGKIKSFDKVQKTLFDLNMAVDEAECVSKAPILLKIYSPKVPDLTMIDLPGYIQVSNANQPKELKQKIRDLCETYIQEPNIILAVCAADVDLANSEALRSSLRVDPKGVRTIGVITKMDLVEPDIGNAILNTKDYPLALGYVGVVNKGTSNSQAMMQHESDIFKRHKFDPSLVGTTTLRKRLVSVLESHMSKSLGSISRKVESELDDCRYNFKVQYNDRRISAESYVADCMDTLKNNFKVFVETFDKATVKNSVSTMLEQKMVGILEKIYWDDVLATDIGNEGSQQVWEAKLDQATAMLTRSGVGKSSVTLILEQIHSRLKEITSTESWKFHQIGRDEVLKYCTSFLEQRFHSTIDQVENTIKPFKFEVDCTESEWKDGKLRSIQILEDEILQTKQELLKIKKKLGRRQLLNSMKYLAYVEQMKERNDLPLPVDLPPQVLADAEKAIITKGKITILQNRISTLKSSKCAYSTSKRACPEIFETVITQKLAQTAVLFIYIELLNEFFFQLPRLIDNKLYYSLDKEQIRQFAEENPTVRDHLKLQDRKDLLETVKRKLDELDRFRRID